MADELIVESLEAEPDGDNAKKADVIRSEKVRYPSKQPTEGKNRDHAERITDDNMPRSKRAVCEKGEEKNEIVGIGGKESDCGNGENRQQIIHLRVNVRKSPNAPMSGAGVRSAEASARLAGVRPAWA